MRGPCTDSLFAQQAAGLQRGVGECGECLGLLLLLVEHGDEVAGLGLVQRDALQQPPSHIIVNPGPLLCEGTAELCQAERD